MPHRRHNNDKRPQPPPRSGNDSQSGHEGYKRDDPHGQRAVQHEGNRYCPPYRNHGCLRSSSSKELPVRLASRYKIHRKQSVHRQVHNTGCSRRLLHRLHNGLRKSRRGFCSQNRALQRRERSRRRAGV